MDGEVISEIVNVMIEAMLNEDDCQYLVMMQENITRMATNSALSSNNQKIWRYIMIADWHVGD